MVLQSLNVCCNTRIDIYLAERVCVKAVVITLPQIHKNGNLTAIKIRLREHLHYRFESCPHDYNVRWRNGRRGLKNGYCILFLSRCGGMADTLVLGTSASACGFKSHHLYCTDSVH